jgi:hypothetical protein
VLPFLCHRTMVLYRDCSCRPALVRALAIEQPHDRNKRTTSTSAYRTGLQEEFISASRLAGGGFQQSAHWIS